MHGHCQEMHEKKTSTLKGESQDVWALPGDARCTKIKLVCGRIRGHTWPSYLVKRREPRCMATARRCTMHEKKKKHVAESVAIHGLVERRESRCIRPVLRMKEEQRNVNGRVSR